ncbi:protein O-linked-mannose beta-1,4-N-acetylglucosaminyltransferase 2-like [Bacillus rossius redtenbacheri]|uniref:protein O-linked-mannose beta-1,4-N-acetylglucosaminyltransferase 2-like n=1 Tax=Bacillus rossius redtenbacheri TaxID=93214 RepID=UPI002FDD8283
MVRKFSVFIKKKLLDNAVRTTMYKSVLVSRKINRKILNEHFVIESVKNAVRSNFPEMSDKKFYSVDLTVNRTGDIVSLLAESKLLVGMHGSAMILSMFMEPGSVVIEMFPYAINASHVSAVRSLCNLKSLGLVYRSWTNMEESNSVPHPESPPLLGGIVHLSPDEQQHVRSVYPVPAVYCCHDPAYLYRMFQDTIVGDGFVEVLGSAFQELKNLSERRSSVEFEKRWRKWYFPAEVTGIGCDIGADKRTVRFTWMPPVNVGAWDVLTYKLAVVGAGMALLTLVSSQPWLSVNLPPDVAGDIHLNIWVKSEVNSSESADVHSLCHVRV